MRPFNKPHSELEDIQLKEDENETPQNLPLSGPHQLELGERKVQH
jgi:hypothetical protein